MPVPKKRTPSARRDRRRSHHALSAVQTVECASCGAQTLPHRACAQCGTYKGRQIMTGDAARQSRKEQRKAALKRAHKEQQDTSATDTDASADTSSQKEKKDATKEDKK